MSNPTARRYALALYEEAAQTGAADRVAADVQALAETLDGSRDLAAMVTSPVVSREKKQAVFTRLFEGTFSPLTLNFLRLLLAKQREDRLPEIVAAFAALRDAETKTVEAHVQTARPLGFDEAEALRKALEARAGQSVRMRVQVEPALIGGVVVQIGDRVYDRSVRHQLRTLGAQLHERAYLSSN